MEELGAEIRRIDPPAFPTVERIPVDDGREAIVVSVRQGASRPYTYRGTAYCRAGNATLAMSADEYNRMLFARMHSGAALGEPACRRVVDQRPRRDGSASGQRMADLGGSVGGL